MTTLQTANPIAPLCPRPILALEPIREPRSSRASGCRLDEGDDCSTPRAISGACASWPTSSAIRHAPGRGVLQHQPPPQLLQRLRPQCKFCEFYRKKDEDGAYTRDLDYIRERRTHKAIESRRDRDAHRRRSAPLPPLGLLPRHGAARIREVVDSAGSDLHIKAFTAVEIVHLAQDRQEVQARRPQGRHPMGPQELKDAGLGSLPGGGAEVFDDRVHDEAFKGKIGAHDAWLDVHTVAHELGLNSNCTMLYGHIEAAHRAPRAHGHAPTSARPGARATRLHRRPRLERTYSREYEGDRRQLASMRSRSRARGAKLPHPDMSSRTRRVLPDHHPPALLPRRVGTRDTSTGPSGSRTCAPSRSPGSCSTTSPTPRRSGSCRRSP